jgi:DNA mismatch repair ATPase MutS
MAGEPHHATTGYIARLFELSRNVAVRKQMAYLRPRRCNSARYG